MKKANNDLTTYLILCTVEKDYKDNNCYRQLRKQIEQALYTNFENSTGISNIFPKIKEFKNNLFCNNFKKLILPIIDKVELKVSSILPILSTLDIPNLKPEKKEELINILISYNLFAFLMDNLEKLLKDFPDNEKIKFIEKIYEKGGGPFLKNGVNNNSKLNDDLKKIINKIINEKETRIIEERKNIRTQENKEPTKEILTIKEKTPKKEPKLPKKENKLPKKENKLPTKEPKLPTKENKLPTHNTLSKEETNLPKAKELHQNNINIEKKGELINELFRFLLENEEYRELLQTFNIENDDDIKQLVLQFVNHYVYHKDEEHIVAKFIKFLKTENEELYNSFCYPSGDTDSQLIKFLLGIKKILEKKLKTLDNTNKNP